MCSRFDLLLLWFYLGPDRDFGRIRCHGSMGGMQHLLNPGKYKERQIYLHIFLHDWRLRVI